MNIKSSRSWSKIAEIFLSSALLCGNIDAATTSSFALHHVAIFDGERTLPSANLIVRDGRIEALGEMLPLPPDLPVVEGAGDTVIPGLIDTHVHARANGQRDALRMGITTELDMGTLPGMLGDLRGQRASFSPTGKADLWTAGYLATVKGGHGTEYGFTIPVLGGASEARSFVESRLKEGSDYLKIIIEDGSALGWPLPTLNAEEVKGLIGAAHENHVLAVVHASTQRGAILCLENSADALAHVFYDEIATPETVLLAKEHHAFVIATLAVLASLSGTEESSRLLLDPDLKPFLSPEQRSSLESRFPRNERWSKFFETALENIRHLHQAGVVILAGTDAPNPGTAHGASLHEELELLVRAGLTPSEALSSATALAARSFGLGDRGRIAPGFRADLVLVKGNPAENILATRRIVQIWKNGAPVDRTPIASPTGK